MHSTREFIARAGEQAWRTTSEFEDTFLYCFAVPADPARVGGVLRTYLARPSHELGLPLDVRATTLGHVFFVFLDTNRKQDHPELSGAHRELIFAIVVPALQYHPQPRFVTFAPYVYASETPGWCADREIFGYPQQHGHITLEPRSKCEPPLSLTLRAHAIDRFARDAVACEHEIVSLRYVGPPSRGVKADDSNHRASLLRSCAALLDIDGVNGLGERTPRAARQPWFGVTADDLAFFDRSAGAWKERRPRLESLPDPDKVLSDPLVMLFLKQFRDVVFADRACYQAIVEATLEGSYQEPPVALGEYDLTLHDRDSAPIRRELGIPPGPVRVDRAFMVRLERWGLKSPAVVSNPAWNPAIEVSMPDEPSRLPPYVDRGGELVWRQPSRLVNARLYGFGVRVPDAHQRTTLDRYVNSLVDRTTGPSETTARFSLKTADLGVVLLLFVDYERVGSATDDDERLGAVSYREFVAMQLAIRDDGELGPQLDWFVPFIYLDVDAPRLGGREIYGYPKQLGTIVMSRAQEGSRTLDAPCHLDLGALVIPSPGAPAAPASIVTVRACGQTPTIAKIYRDSPDMFLDLLTACGGGEHVERVVGSLQRPAPRSEAALARDIQVQNALVLSNIGNVFLKQFRDCADPSQACYQAICRTDTVPGVFRRGGRLRPEQYEIVVHGHHSEPLLDFLGCKDSGRPPEVAFAYFLELDLELARGRVVANPFSAPLVEPLSAS